MQLMRRRRRRAAKETAAKETGGKKTQLFQRTKSSLMNAGRPTRESVPSIPGEYLCSDSNCVPLSLQAKQGQDEGHVCVCALADAPVTEETVYPRWLT